MLQWRQADSYPSTKKIFLRLIAISLVLALIAGASGWVYFDEEHISLDDAVRAQLTIIENAKHVPGLDQPELFNSSLMGFLAE